MENQNKLFEIINDNTISTEERVERMKGLQKQGIDFNQATTASGATGLHLACRIGNLDIAQFLAENNIDLNAQDNYGMTALHDASFWGYVDIVDYLLSKGIDWKIRDNNNKTALFYAKLQNRVKVVNTLSEIEEKSKRNATDTTPATSEESSEPDNN